MRQWLFTAVFLLVTGLFAGGASASCAVHQDLSRLHVASRGFLTYLDTGTGPYYVQELRGWISMNPPGHLLQRMRAVGIQTAEASTVKLVEQQTALLEVLRSQGRSAAKKNARALGLDRLITQFGRQVEYLACDTAKEDGTGSKLVAVAAQDARQRRQIINAGIAWTSFLILGGSILYFLDRIGIRKIRRTKRFPCSIPCTVQTGDRSMQAHLVDISRAGAKVRLDNVSVVPGRLTLKFGGYSMASQVRWQTPDYFGVKFAKDFNFMQLHRLLEDFPMSDEEPVRKRTRVPAQAQAR